MQPLGWLRSAVWAHETESMTQYECGRERERKSIELMPVANVLTKRVTTELIGITAAAAKAVVAVAVARRMAILNQFHTNCLHIAQISNDLWAVIWVFSFVSNDSRWPSAACSMLKLQHIYTHFCRPPLCSASICVRKWFNRIYQFAVYYYSISKRFSKCRLGSLAERERKKVHASHENQ